MPNGGSDCCGTCWFNLKNEGEVGYDHTDSPEPDYCEIRDLAVDDPFYTYCANHPHRNSRKLRVPLGPVFRGDSDGHREVWMNSPDSEHIRRQLLALLVVLPETGENEYPIGPHLGEIVIAQLLELREERAIPELRRIARLDESEPDRFGNTDGPLIELARQALNQMAGDERESPSR